MGDDIAVAGVRFKLAEESNIYSELTEKACHGSGLSTAKGFATASGLSTAKGSARDLSEPWHQLYRALVPAHLLHLRAISCRLYSQYQDVSQSL